MNLVVCNTFPMLFTHIIRYAAMHIFSVPLRFWCCLYTKIFNIRYIHMEGQGEGTFMGLIFCFLKLIPLFFALLLKSFTNDYQSLPRNTMPQPQPSYQHCCRLCTQTSDKTAAASNALSLCCAIDRQQQQQQQLMSHWPLLPLLSMARLLLLRCCATFCCYSCSNAAVNHPFFLNRPTKLRGRRERTIEASSLFFTLCIS